MNLETVEQRCVAYLRDVQKPFVMISQLLDVLHEDEDLRELDKAQLLDFLRNHELFTVFDPISLPENPEELEELRQAGMMTEPGVMLTSRIPSKEELFTAMEQQMGTMLNALESALSQARDNDPSLAMRVQSILKRARDIQHQLEHPDLGKS